MFSGFVRLLHEVGNGDWYRLLYNYLLLIRVSFQPNRCVAISCTKVCDKDRCRKLHLLHNLASRLFFLSPV